MKTKPCQINFLILFTVMLGSALFSATLVHSEPLYLNCPMQWDMQAGGNIPRRYGFYFSDDHQSVLYREFREGKWSDVTSERVITFNDFVMKFGHVTGAHATEGTIDRVSGSIIFEIKSSSGGVDKTYWRYVGQCSKDTPWGDQRKF